MFAYSIVPLTEAENLLGIGVVFYLIVGSLPRYGLMLFLANPVRTTGFFIVHRR